MRRLLSTAKTTLLPANHSLDTKKGLHSNERLDDNQGQNAAIERGCVNVSLPRDCGSLAFVCVPEVGLPASTTLAFSLVIQG